MPISDTLKEDAAKVEAAAKADAAGFLAKTFTGKTVLIVAAVAFALGLLVHLL